MSYILVHQGEWPLAGRYFFRGNEASRFSIEGLAHALSQLCRFTGHTTRFYSVAEHCCHVHDLLEDDLKLAGLLHDAHEAIVGDVSTPLKELLPDYRWIEERVQNEVLTHFAVDPSLMGMVKWADLVMLATERRDLMSPDPMEWPILRGVAPLGLYLNRWYRRPWSPTRAKREFLNRYYKLKGIK